MSTVGDLRSYRFAHSSQWSLGLCDQLSVTNDGLRLPTRYGPAGMIPDSHGAQLLWTSEDGLHWRSDDGRIAWLGDGADRRAHMPCPEFLDRATRVVSDGAWLWVVTAGEHAIHRLDARSFCAVDVIEFKSENVRDATGDGCAGLWVLLASGARERVVHVGRGGAIDRTLALPAQAQGATGIAFLGKVGKSGRIALLVAATSKIVLVDLASPDKAEIADLSAMLPPGAVPACLRDDQSARIIVLASVPAGADASGCGLLLDEECAPLASFAAATLQGRAARALFHDAILGGKRLRVATSAGIARFEPVVTAPADAAARAAHRWLTPALRSPVTGPLRGWLRADLSASIPDGARITITPLHTNDGVVARQVEQLVADGSKSMPARIDAIRPLLQEDATESISYPLAEDGPQSHATGGVNKSEPLGVPLFAITDSWLWLLVEMSAAPDGSLPGITELRVWYPNVSLQQYLPAIFRGSIAARGASVADASQAPLVGDPTGFLRRLLGVLETSTQALDRQIAGLGACIHPDTASGPWLDYVAHWMDMPWDETLHETLKRRLIKRLPTLLASRGTRAGLHALLDALLPDSSIDILDADVDLGLARLGAPAVQGSRLPAILAGLPANAAVLDRRAVLGTARLPTANDADPVARFLGVVRIRIATTPDRRAAVETALPALLQAMVPAGVRPVVHWRPPPRSAARDTRKGVLVRLADPAPARLGMEATLGAATLTGQRLRRLPRGGLLPGFLLQ